MRADPLGTGDAPPTLKRMRTPSWRAIASASAIMVAEGGRVSGNWHVGPDVCRRFHDRAMSEAGAFLHQGITYYML